MLSGRTVLVTGATSGIGAGLAAAYADAGARVFATGRNEEALRGLTATHQRISPIAADLATDAGRRTIATAIDHAGGALDVAVHAAGLLGPPDTPLVDYPEEDWHAVFHVNVTAVHLLHQRLAPLLARSAAPVVIGLASTVGRQGRAGWGMYAVSKHALEGWLGTLAGEFAGRVYSVNPGGTRTPMRAVAVPGEDPATLPTPADIAPIFLHLAQADSPIATGARLDARDWIGSDPWTLTP
jgi:NAD(P)-dependent dehydrogenase (short-subunit alcohol dehydrogenase family)